MTRRFRGLVLAPLTAMLAVLLAPSASADTYTDQLVGKYNAQTHVVADPGANPALRDPDRLNDQILTSRWTWSSTPPIWVAAVAPSQTGVTTPDAIHNVILGRNPAFSGIILVIDSRGYHVRAYNVPKAIADSVDPFMSQSARSHRNDPQGATSEFVSKLTRLDVSSGGPASTTSPVVHKNPDRWAWLWTMLVFIAVALSVVALVSFAVGRSRKRRKAAQEREQIKQELIAAESGVGDIDNAVLANSDTDVSAESTKANASLYDARKAYETGDYGAARAHLRVVESTVARAYQKLGRPVPNVGAVDSVPEDERKQASVRAKNPDTGEYVTINNNNYSTAPQPGYPHYYGGGYYNGMFFYPGYYPYAFWGAGWGWALTDVLLMDAVLDDHWGGSYDRGFEAGRDSAYADANYDGGQGAGYDSQQGDVGFGGGYDSGADTGFAGNEGSYSGGDDVDFGGGWDSGGGSDFGGSDFGGGGSDSSGGDFGF
ncbi:hypothetical protein [Mycobacterium sp. 852014-50255_SCH5639931]|uniref:hypothetical protein n=1 Tax=Mycobacterium sp. 852014-50255_SCH5639931 TaxID=1834112 RepID=UPI0007FD4349|nr:hypothetical protein [Mycobacterium sp. 852014-50255_SCH5639931]OBB68963.1 hypothetical protein A5758_07245 [Mycobacterium sp. 852014-50255_SCH5639931]